MQTCRRGELGAAAVEYALIVFAIAATIIFVVFALGTWTRGSYQSFCDETQSLSSNC